MHCQIKLNLLFFFHLSGSTSLINIIKANTFIVTTISNRVSGRCHFISKASVQIVFLSLCIMLNVGAGYKQVYQQINKECIEQSTLHRILASTEIIILITICIPILLSIHSIGNYCCEKLLEN